MHDIERLYLEVYTPAVKLMSRILGGDYAAAEDVTQEAFTRAWKFYPSYNPNKGKLKTWFNSILFNALRDYQRELKIGPQPTNQDISWEDVLQDLNPEDKAWKREFLIASIKGTKNPIHRDVLELFFINGYTSTEISQIIEKISQSNVTTIVMRFREELKNV